MPILGIETAIMNRGSVAILDNERIILEQYERQDDYRDRLWPAIVQVFKKARLSLEKIEAIAVSQGPGSFTGLRVGITVAKTLALCLEKPLLGIPTLEILLQGVNDDFALTESHSATLLVPLLDAKKNLVYTAIFEKENKNFSKIKVERKTEDLVLTIDEICRMIKKPAIFFGEGLKVYQSFIQKSLGNLAHFAPEEFFFPKASVVAQLGKKKLKLKKKDNLYELQPIYLRNPEISLSSQRKKNG